MRCIYQQVVATAGYLDPKNIVVFGIFNLSTTVYALGYKFSYFCVVCKTYVL